MNTNPNTTQESDTNLPPQPLGNFGYSLALSLGILFVLVLITYASYKCRRPTAAAAAILNRRSTSLPTTVHGASFQQKGLDSATISTYPHFTYAQLKPHKSHDSAGSGCSICLGEYKDTDLIRLLPDCGHFYHLSCVDRWLMVHPTCPVCRTSPSPISNLS